MIITIAIATYTFTSLTMAIIDSIKYRKYNSPILSAGKSISLAAACVSMLTLETTMLTIFNDGSKSVLFRKMMLGISGAVVSVVIITMALYMIIRSTKRLKESKEKTNGK